MTMIGICGNGDKVCTGTLIKDIIGHSCSDVHCYMNIEEWKKSAKAHENHTYEIVQLSSGSIPTELKLDILVQVSSEQHGLGTQRATRHLKSKGYIIINSDSMNQIDLKYRDLYVVSYGLNCKATVTASSIDDVQGLSFSYYLQRAVPIMGKGIIQPFETPISVRGDAKDIYSCLAAYTCVMILGIEI